MAPNHKGRRLNHPLRDALEATIHSLKDVTVLAAQNDPFRLDTPAGHRDGQWLAEMFAMFNLRGKHNRGIHYALLGQKKPDGLPYTGNDWKWLAGPIDAARWLGYIPFDDIVDERNLPPVIRLWRPFGPQAGIDCGNWRFRKSRRDSPLSSVVRNVWQATLSSGDLWREVFALPNPDRDCGFVSG